MDAPFGDYLKIKPQDNMLIFLFAKARQSFLTQSIYSCIKMFLWTAFTLYSIKYAILGQFWVLFWKYYPLDIQQYLRTSC